MNKFLQHIETLPGALMFVAAMFLAGRFMAALLSLLDATR